MRFCSAIFACGVALTFTPAAAQPSAQAYIACLKSEVARLDDRRSSVMTIAIVVARACRPVLRDHAAALSHGNARLERMNFEAFTRAEASRAAGFVLEARRH